MILDFSWLATLSVGLFTWYLYLVRHYLKTRSFPPGPFPLPVVGNLLKFRRREVNEVFEEFRKHYGDVFTVWMGSAPYIVVAGVAAAKEGLVERRNDFAGRTEFHAMKAHLDGNSDIATGDYGPTWETLKKMGLAAIRKYAFSDELPSLVDETTNEIVGNMLKEKNPFDSQDHIKLLISKIIASSILGQRFHGADDPDYLACKETGETFKEAFGKGSIGDFIPFLLPFCKGVENRVKKAGHAATGLFFTKLQEHIATYQNGVIRDIIDSLLSVREEVIAEGKDSAVYMNDKNLTHTIFDLYFGAVETTQITVRWILLYLATYPDIQERVIRELRDNIGDGMPVQADRKKCPITCAVIDEALRIRTTVPFGLPHKAICNSQIGGYHVEKGTYTLFCLYIMHHDPKIWENPEQFCPERFLEKNGTYKETRRSQYMPFGQGRRSCVGEKLAVVQLFLVLAGIFRRCKIELEEPPEDMTPLDNNIFYMPKPYKIVVKPIVN